MKGRLGRILLAILISPLAILPVIIIFSLLTDFDLIRQPSYFDWLFLFAAFGLAIALPATVLVGLPSYFLMLRLDQSSYVKFGVVGAFTSIVGGWLFVEPSLHRTDLEFMALFAASGAVVALAFRRIAGTPSPYDVADTHSNT